MLKKIKILYKLLVIFTFVLGFSCVKIDPTNPKDSLYLGEYSFDIDSEDLPSDTLEIFTVYKINFTSTGVDTFAAVGIYDTTGANILDTANFSFNDSDSTVSLYFTKPYSGLISFGAIRPNGKIMLITLDSLVHIINPYKSTVNQSVKDTIKIGINSRNQLNAQKNYLSDNAPEGLKIRWDIGDDSYSVVWAESKETFFTSGTFDLTYNAYVVDTFNQSYLIDSKIIQVEGNAPIISTVIFPDTIMLGDTIVASFIVNDSDIADSFSIEFSTPTGTMTSDSIVWYPADTNVQEIKFVKPILDTGKINMSVVAVDKLESLVSNTVTKQIEVLYTLPEPEFSDSIIIINVGDSVKISFVDPNYEEGVFYNWSILGVDSTSILGIPDSSSNSTIIMLDSIDTLNISVYGTNKYGFSGTPVNLSVISMKFDYTISFSDTIPDTLSSNKIYKFSAIVRNSLNEIVTDNVNYIWSLGDSALTDTVYQDSNSLNIKIKNESGPFLVSVYAIIDSLEVTPITSHPVKINKKPIVEFENTELDIRLGDPIIFRFNVSDDGKIDSVRMSIDSVSVINPSVDSLGTYFYEVLNIDTIWSGNVYAWAFDDEGNSSDTIMGTYKTYTEEPVFSNLFNSASILIYENYTIKLPAVDPGNKISGIKQYLWDTDGDKKFDIFTTEDSLLISKPTPFNDTITVAAISFFGDTSTINYKFHLTVGAGAPIINKFEIAESDTNYAFIYEKIDFLLVAIDSGGNVKSIHIDINGDNVADTSFTIDSAQSISALFSLHFTNGGEYSITAWVEDDHNNYSNKVVLADTIFIDQGLPVIDSFKMEDTIYIKDTLNYKIFASDIDGKVEFYYWSLDSTDFDSLGSIDSFSYAFQSSGLTYVYIKIADNFNNSVIIKDSIDVLLGKPSATSIIGDTVIWVNDSMNYTFNFNDENDFVDSIHINWGDGSSLISYDVKGMNSLISGHTYPILEDTNYQIILIVQDNDNVKDTCVKNVLVKMGKPEADTIIGDTSIWVNDDETYIFQYSDENDSVDSIYVNWGDDTVFTAYSASDSGYISLVHKYAITADTSYEITMIVKDIDGITDTNTLDINVNQGLPIINSVLPETVHVLDSEIFTINATGLNDKIDSFWINWSIDTSGGWGNSLPFNQTADTVQVTKSFAIPDTGINTYWIRVMDEDGLYASQSYNVYVALGRPTIGWLSDIHSDSIQWVKGENGDLDTMFYVYRDGDSYIGINSFDTTSFVSAIYWDRENNATIDYISSPDSLFKTNINCHEAQLFSVYAVDNHNIESDTMVFYAYPDSVPIEPAVNANLNTDSITIQWFGHDKKDSVNTEFKILYKRVDSPTPVPDLDPENDILYGFSEGGSNFNYTEQNTGYSYSFIPYDGSGYYFFQIIARDKRGSETISTNKPFVNYQ